MKKNFQVLVALFLLLIIVSCSVENDVSQTIQTAPPIQGKAYTYLALGDSYTIGESVCETCRFPAQLSKKLVNLNPKNTYSHKIIAQTGWTTTNLLSAIGAQNPSSNYDLVTLLIGVNNQYQNKPFSLYEKEFPELVNKAIAFAKGDKSNVIVVSIPDYAFTPFGQASSNPAAISSQIDRYNEYAKNYCEANSISFIFITDSTRQGLANKNLVASDGLHPSELAYSLFVERMFPTATTAIHN
ncbi:SGNH/GDSL hydrolase family protein [Flavobacterium sp. XS2P14]|uniref:SGNH/GDSL hydrolase family protein n=1 Tax=Flavobacterium sp. XS2P14 TaxID=3401735 RepID=UPI003AAA8041